MRRKNLWAKGQMTSLPPICTITTKETKPVFTGKYFIHMEQVSKANTKFRVTFFSLPLLQATDSNNPLNILNVSNKPERFKN